MGIESKTSGRWVGWQARDVQTLGGKSETSGPLVATLGVQTMALVTLSDEPETSRLWMMNLLRRLDVDQLDLLTLDDGTNSLELSLTKLPKQWVTSPKLLDVGWQA